MANTLLVRHLYSQYINEKTFTLFSRHFFSCYDAKSLTWHSRNYPVNDGRKNGLCGAALRPHETVKVFIENHPRGSGMTMKNRHFATRSLIALAVASAFPLHGALAQEAAPAEPAKAGQLETVIVTAQRRAENIKDVPMAIATLKGEKLDVLTASGQDIRFLSGRAPSLTIESDFGR